MKKVAVVTARKGSKRMANKNFLPFYDGKSLTEIALEQAINSKVFSKIVLLCDEQDFNRYIEEKYGTKILVINRPENVSQSDTSTKDTIIKCLQSLKMNEKDLICLLQPTSPLRIKGVIERSLNQLLESNETLVCTVSKPMQEINDMKLVKKGIEQVSVEWPIVVFEDGQVYWLTCERLVNHIKPFEITESSQMIETEPETAIDIDYEFQFKIAAMVYSSYRNKWE